MITTTNTTQTKQARKWTEREAIQPRVQHSIDRLATHANGATAIILANGNMMLLEKLNFWNHFIWHHMNANGELIESGKSPTAFGFCDAINRAALR